MILRFLGRILANYLNRPSSGYVVPATSSLDTLREVLEPGDVLLVEGNLRISAAIKYLTQSTWSHAALYVGDTLGLNNSAGEALSLIEADLCHGVIAVPLRKYANFHVRICRAVGLIEEDRNKIIQYAASRIGNTYDLKNVVDLLRYLLPTPPVPTPWRRRLLAFGSGDPTKAICSTLIAQAFQSVRYPILPTVKTIRDGGASTYAKEILHIRHHSLFAPRDFDISPYFQIIKPTIENGFRYTELKWGE
jgi:hypothetical protein